MKKLVLGLMLGMAGVTFGSRDTTNSILVEVSNHQTQKNVRCLAVGTATYSMPNAGFKIILRVPEVRNEEEVLAFYEKYSEDIFSALKKVCSILKNEIEQRLTENDSESLQRLFMYLAAWDDSEVDEELVREIVQQTGVCRANPGRISEVSKELLAWKVSTDKTLRRDWEQFSDQKTQILTVLNFVAAFQNNGNNGGNV